MKKSELKHLIRETIDEVFGTTSSKFYASLKGKTVASVEEHDHVLVMTFTDGTEIQFDTPQMIGHKMSPPTNT